MKNGAPKAPQERPAPAKYEFLIVPADEWVEKT
jgi:hypothetical protein